MGLNEGLQVPCIGHILCNVRFVKDLYVEVHVC
jgi:hypothetical protein